mgnify:CR=1 FL=1
MAFLQELADLRLEPKSEAEIDALMEEAEREQRQLYMQKVREELRESRGRPRHELPGGMAPLGIPSAEAEAVAALLDGHEVLLGLLGRHCTCAWYRRAAESDHGLLDELWGSVARALAHVRSCLRVCMCVCVCAGARVRAVSYTHLTLPTILLV